MHNSTDTLADDILTSEEQRIIMDYVASRMMRVYEMSPEERTRACEHVKKYANNMIDRQQSTQILSPNERAFYEVIWLRQKEDQQTSILHISSTNEQKKASVKVLIEISLSISYVNAKSESNPYWYHQAILDEYQQRGDFHILRTYHEPIFKMVKPHYLQPLSELELLFAHVYFETLEKEDRSTTQDRIIAELTRLYEDPTTHHVMAALGYLLMQKQGKLVFKATQLNNLGIVAYFSNRDRIIYGCIDQHPIRPYGNAVIHESLHFIFAMLYDNHCLPFFEKDQKFYHTLSMHIKDLHYNLKALPVNTMGESGVWQCMSELAKYIELDKNNAQDTLLLEAIVRPMELLAGGCVKGAVCKYADGIWSFYQKNCLPKINEFLTQCRYEYRKPGGCYNINPNKKIEFSLPEGPDVSGVYRYSPTPRSHKQQPIGNCNLQELSDRLDFSVLIPGAVFDSRYKKNFGERSSYFYCPGFFTRTYLEDFDALGRRLFETSYQCQLLRRWYHLKSEAENWSDMRKYWYRAAVTSMSILLCILNPIAALAHFLLRFIFINTLACFGDLIGLTTFNANPAYQDLGNFPANESWADTYRVMMN